MLPRNRLLLYAGILVIAISLVVLLGWLTPTTPLTNFFYGYSAMKINTAIALILSGSKLLIHFFFSSKRWFYFGRIFSILILSVGFLSISQDIFNINLYLDEFLAKDIEARIAGNPAPGRMSPITAICFICMGLFFLTNGTKPNRYQLIAQWLLHIVTFFSFIAIVGYLFNVPVFYKLSFLTSMAVLTAFSFLILSIAASLIHPKKGITGLFNGTKPGNLMARKLFLQMTVSILVLTFFRIEAHRLKLVDVEFGIALFGLSFILVLLFLIWRTSEAINKSEFKKSRAELDFQQINVFLNTTPDPILIINNKGIIHLVNDKAAEIFGYNRTHLIGQNITILLPLKFRSKTNELLNNSFFRYQLINQPPDENALCALRADGHEFPIEVNFSPFELSGVQYISASVRDVSERRQMVLALKSSERRNRIFIEQSPNAIAMYDKEMRLMAASKKWVADYKLEGSEIIGSTHYELFPEIGDDWKKIHQECLDGAINTCDEAPFERQDGTIQWISWDVRPWYAAEDLVGGLIMCTADITPQKEKDKERRKIENILEKSNRVAKIAHWEVDAKTGKTTWSQMANEIYDLPEDYQPQIESVFHYYKPGPNLDQLKAAIEQSVRHGQPYDLEVELITAKGNSKWIRIIGDAEFEKGVCTRRVGILQDITRTKNIESTIIRINDELDAILNSGHVSIIGTDTNGLITHFSTGAEKLLQYQKSEIIGIHSPALLHVPNEVEQRGEELSKLYNKKISGFDVFIAAVGTENFDSHEWNYVRKDGTIFPVQLVVTAIKNREGKVSGYLGVATDISDIKKAERELLQLMVITNGQNERLKNFAHIVSHNLRSHAGNFALMLDLLATEEPELAEHDYIKLIKKASDNLTETIANLNEVVIMNSTIEQNLVSIDLKSAINLAIHSVSSSISECGIKITNEVGDELKVLGVAAYVESILLNFITNGIKYRALNRPSELKLSCVKTTDWVILSIADNGIGIDLKKYGTKLFGMYKTFHPHPDARGIGLFITKNQVEALGGKIEVTSEINEGTHFKIYFKYEES